MQWVKRKWDLLCIQCPDLLQFPPGEILIEIIGLCIWDLSLKLGRQRASLTAVWVLKVQLYQ